MEFIFASCTNNKTIAQVFCTSLPVAERPPGGDIRRRAAPERDRALRHLVLVEVTGHVRYLFKR